MTRNVGSLLMGLQKIINLQRLTQFRMSEAHAAAKRFVGDDQLAADTAMRAKPSEDGLR